MTSPMLRVTIFLALALPAAQIRADEVLFKNGDRLTGTIESIEGSKLTIDSKVGGKTTVDLKDVRTFNTDGPLRLKLADGSVAHQRVAAGPDGQVVVRPDGAGAARNVPLDQIRTAGPAGVKWSGNVVAGGLLARGNTNTDTFNAAVNVVRRSEQDRLTFDAGYIFGREHIKGIHGTHETADDLFGELKYDYFFTEKLYGYADVRAEHDTIAKLNLLLTPGVGAGYQWFDSPDLSFNTEAGIGYLHRQFSHDGSTDGVSGRLAYHLKFKFNQQVGLFHDFEYYPGLDNINNYLFTTDLGVRATITGKLFTEFKIDYRYNSRPAPGSGPNDIRYILGVGWQF